MCLLLKGDNPVTAYEALRVLHRATTIFMSTVEVALADYLRPDISVTPGVPVEVAPRPLEGHLDTTSHVSRLEATMKRAVSLLILGGVVSALTACDQRAADRANDGSVPRPPSSSTGIPAVVARDHAVSAYREMWSAFATAGKTSDWQSPALGQHATGIALDKLTRSLRADQDKGLVTKGSPTLSPQVSAVDPASDPLKVTITDCGDSTNALKYRKDNGQLANDVPGGRRLINAIVEKQADGKWKVTDFGVHDLGTCK